MNKSRLPRPPLTRRDELCEILHGVPVSDPYRWLEDGKAAETRAWLSAQREYARPLLDIQAREPIRVRLAQLMKTEAVGLPIERHGYYFYPRRLAHQQRSAIWLRHGLHGEEEVLVDANTMSTDAMAGVHIAGISLDGSTLAYGVRQGGEDQFSIHFLAVASRRDLPDTLPRARYTGASWAHDGSGLYYAMVSAEGPRIRFHRLGTDVAEDREIVGSSWGSDRWPDAFVTGNGRYLIVGCGYPAASMNGDRHDLYVGRLGPEGESELIPIANDLDAASFGLDAGDALMVLTNWQAPNRRVFRVDLANPSRENWREVVPEGPSVIGGFATAGGRLLLFSLEDVHSRLRIYEADGTFARELELPGTGTVAGFEGQWNRTESFFSYSSYDHAPTSYRYDMQIGSREVWWQQPNVPDLSQFEIRQVWYPSRDGTRIPMHVFHKRGLKLDGARPTLLHGYGGFNFSILPAYSTMATVWAEAGGVFASANIRGGGEFGEEWHRAGRREKKQNVFDDFISAAEWLIANRYTQPSRLAITGGSNGGLLVCAALIQRPDLFRAIICHRPVIDMLRYHRDLIGALCTGEYGCADLADDFPYLLAYSPYHNVHHGTRYPAVMIVTGDSDTRCDPMHARKMTAMLQWATASDSPILLNYRPEAGHMPGLSMDATIDEAADDLTFLFRELDMTM